MSSQVEYKLIPKSFHSSVGDRASIDARNAYDESTWGAIVLRPDPIQIIGRFELVESILRRCSAEKLIGVSRSSPVSNATACPSVDNGDINTRMKRGPNVPGIEFCRTCTVLRTSAAKYLSKRLLSFYRTSQSRYYGDTDAPVDDSERHGRECLAMFVSKRHIPLIRLNNISIARYNDGCEINARGDAARAALAKGSNCHNDGDVMVVLKDNDEISILLPSENGRQVLKFAVRIHCDGQEAEHSKNTQVFTSGQRSEEFLSNVANDHCGMRSGQGGDNDARHTQGERHDDGSSVTEGEEEESPLLSMPMQPHAIQSHIGRHKDASGDGGEEQVAHVFSLDVLPTQPTQTQTQTQRLTQSTSPPKRRREKRLLSNLSIDELRQRRHAFMADPCGGQTMSQGQEGRNVWKRLILDVAIEAKRKATNGNGGGNDECFPVLLTKTTL